MTTTLTRLKAQSLKLRELEWALRAEANGIDGNEQAVTLVCSRLEHFNHPSIWGFIKVDITPDGEPVAWVQWGRLIDALDKSAIDLPRDIIAAWHVAAFLACGIRIDFDTAMDDMATETADLARCLLTGGAR